MVIPRSSILAGIPVDSLIIEQEREIGHTDKWDPVEWTLFPTYY
jgi:hypothetical protein